MEGTWQAQLISVCNNGPFCMGVTQLVCLWHGPDGERVWQGAWRRRPGVHDLCACVMGKVGTHTAHLGAHVHTQTHTHCDSLSTRARAHTLSHVCPISVACTLSDTAQLTRSDMLRCHPAYTLSGLTYPQTEFHSHAWTQPHTPVFSRLEHDHALKRYHTLTSLHSHASVFHTLTCGHFTHKHSIQALPLTSICTRAHRS